MPGIPRQINQLGTLQSHQRTWIKKGTKRWLFGLSLHGLSLLWCCDFRKKNMKQVVWLIMLETVSWRRGSATETTDVLCVLVPRNFINGNGDTWDIHETYINMRCSVGGQLLGGSLSTILRHSYHTSAVQRSTGQPILGYPAIEIPPDMFDMKSLCSILPSGT